MDIQEKTPPNLNKIQNIFYNRYLTKYSEETALQLASMHGMSIEGGFVSDPEKYISSHPSAMLAWADLKSPGILEEITKELCPHYGY